MIFASISTSSMERTDQHECFYTATLKLLLLSFGSSALLYLPKLNEMVFTTCLICNSWLHLVDRLKPRHTNTKHLKTQWILYLTTGTAFLIDPECHLSNVNHVSLYATHPSRKCPYSKEITFGSYVDVIWKNVFNSQV
jgi:hypothetical protein